MRYRIFANRRARPEVYDHGEFAQALSDAELVGGVVLDLWKLEWIYPPSPIEPNGRIEPVAPTLRLALVG